MNANIEQPLQGEVYRPSRMLDPTRFQYLWSLAERIVDSSLVPDSIKSKGTGDNKENLPRETVLANVFAIVEQADRWDISPFALIQGASIVHGKLCFEGKIIAGVLEARLGIRLNYTWNDKAGEELGIIVSGKRPGDTEPVTIEGKVADWKTTGNNSPWAPKNFKRMLAYRGAREWTRVFEPAIMLGVFSDDEMMAVAYEAAAQAATPVRSLTERLKSGDVPSAGAEGFSREGAKQALEHKPQVAMDILKDRPTGALVTAATQGASPTTAPVETQKTEPKAEDATNAGHEGAGPDGSATEAHAAASAGAAGSPQTGQPPQESKVSAESRVADEDVGRGEKNNAAPSVNLSEYATILRRATQVKSLQALAAKFWSQNGGWPPKDELLKSKASRIYDICSDLIAQKITPKAADEDLREIVSS